ncbi:DUF6259 domain-containing protein, partial [Gemmatimonas sp.]|uniref:DUF6259 domain-containing protein n=1 Tax=Gemmatimonas sp. TaxID=1962908 RepID=UPI003564020C
HVTALRHGDGRLRAGVANDSVGLWSIALVSGTTAPVTTVIRASEAARFTARRIAQGFELRWSGFTHPALSQLQVTATVTLRRDTTTAWRIALSGMDSARGERGHFPRLSGILIQSRDELAVPSWMGQRTRNPQAMLTTAAGGSRRHEFVYPGAASMQVFALSNAVTGGLYFAADDTAAFRKHFEFWGEGNGRAGYSVAHVLSDPGTHAHYAPAYAAIVGLVLGDWLSAVERYRRWGTKQYWARESRLQAGATPAWMRNTGIWVWNRGTSDQVLEPAALLQQNARLPVSVFWHWWHHGPYDTSFPDYLPPREGAEPFTRAVAKAHEAGLNAIVYMNQRLWCTNTPSWTREGAEQWAVRERDGSVRLETYNVFNPLPCATMNPATPFWRNKYTGIADTVLNQYGLDGIYMDQAVLSLIDWSPNLGHPVGGGNYWMKGFRQLASELRAMSSKRPVGFAGEGGGESWMPDLDAFLTLQVSQERYADPASGWEVIPMFQAAYHPYALTYGTYGSLTLPPYDDLWPADKRPVTALMPLDLKFVRQFHLEQARMFVWGMQPTIANFLPDQLTERRREIDYLEQLARLRYGLREFFQTGVFLRPPRVDVTSAELLLSRISIYAARLGGPTEARITSPEVLVGAFRAADGRVAVALAGINLEPRRIQVTLDRRAYGLPAGTRIVRHDASGTSELGTLGNTPRLLSLNMEPLQGIVLELRTAPGIR